MEASHVMRTLARWKWAIAGAALLCALLAGLASKQLGRQYTASVTLHIRPAQLLMPFDRYALSRADEPPEAPTPEAQQAQTQAMLKTVEAIAKSPAVLGPVIDRFRLPGGASQLQSRIDVKEVSPVLVQLSVTDANPGRAAELATMVTEGFRLVALAQRLDEARRSQEVLRQQLAVLRRDLGDATTPPSRDAALRAAAAAHDYTRILRQQELLQEATTSLQLGGIAQLADPGGAGGSPVDTTAGRTSKLTLTGLLLGGLAAAAMAVFLEAFDRRIRSVADAETFFGEPVLAVVPRAPARWKPLEVATAASAAPASPVAEAFHLLALEVMRRIPARGCLALAGIAARAGQGVTVTVTNLAIAAAQAGKRVILVDADLRQPALHGLFDLSATPGLSDLGRGEMDPRAITRATAVPNLSLASAGAPADNPWSVLRGPEFARFLAALREEADLVLVNTPAASGRTDALSVAATVDGAVLVFRASGVPGAPEAALMATMRQAEIPVLGVVLNDARAGAIEPDRLPVAGAADRADEHAPMAFTSRREAAELRG